MRVKVVFHFIQKDVLDDDGLIAAVEIDGEAAVNGISVVALLQLGQEGFHLVCGKKQFLLLLDGELGFQSLFLLLTLGDALCDHACGFTLLQSRPEVLDGLVRFLDGIPYALDSKGVLIVFADRFNGFCDPLDVLIRQ